MSAGRAVIVALVVAVASAGCLALATRTPAAVRRDDPGRDATRPSLGASFTDAQVARHGAYARSGYIGIGLGLLVQVTTLVLLTRGPLGIVVSHVERWRTGWVVQAMSVAVFIAVVTTVATLPLGFVRYSIQHAWGLSTQDVGGWVSDQSRGLAVAGAIAAITAVAFFGILRWQPRTWWLWGWVSFTALSALLVLVWPVLIAPLFNRFTPLDDAALTGRVRSLAARAGVEIDDVLVADASRRTTAQNAYVAGLGGTRRVVLYDTLLANGDEDETAFVVAHELGHEAKSHVLKGVAGLAVGLLVAFGALWAMSRHGAPWSWAGAEGISDLRALPVLLLFSLLAGLVALPVENTVSRRFEAEADRVAIDLTGDPSTGVRVLRRLAFSNLSDLRPPRALVWALFSHPPIPERIARLTVLGPRDDSGSPASAGP